jgi:hypothetical protein
MSRVVPTIDKRLAAVCQRLRGLATEIEAKWEHGVVHLFSEEHVIQAHRSWRIEVLVPELDDYQHTPEDGELVARPPGNEETLDLLERIVKTCRGARGLESPAAPNVADLLEAESLLNRRPTKGR